MGFFREFDERGKFIRSLDTTFLVLLPKKGGTDDFRDYRPINLRLWPKTLVEGRQILDAVLIANESIDSMLKRNENGVLCKLDVVKAYDHISWNFLLIVMRKMGFGEKWVGWISCRVRGRAGDGIQLTHLLFADDTLVFCEASQESEIFPVGRVDNVEELAFESGCKVGALPSYYLGLPLRAAHNSVASWDRVEERFWKRLVMWKRQFISKGGRITLIRGTLSTIPIYYIFMLRNGKRVRFWEDRWRGDEILSISFPSLYALVTSKEAWVAEVWDTLGEDGARIHAF
ncbi:hypothetical protein CK203_004874 [Vitis vinifera]|uniref:Reverse transcriptase domain-containing protein n=1 Tax=Vitis vinifera TaxID=29760 RepID=A0A438KGJ8_VITVI|nr:hypothetical protein CK203_004874 [Vitis vinifera]